MLDEKVFRWIFKAGDEAINLVDSGKEFQIVGPLNVDRLYGAGQTVEFRNCTVSIASIQVM